MTYLNDAPCRVSADLTRRDNEENNLEPGGFDPYLEEHVDTVAPYHFRKAIYELLMTREQLEYINSEHLRQTLKEDLDRLYRACIDEWNDI